MEGGRMNHAPLKDNRSLGELFSDLSQEMQRLFQDEAALLRSEMSQKISRAAKDITALAVGGAVLYAGLLAIITAGILALGIAIPLWLSALIVGVVVLAIGTFLVLKGVQDLKRADLKPSRTISSLKGDKEWLKEKT